MADGRVLIVGGAGYFGARLAEALIPSHGVCVTHRSLGSARAAWLSRSGASAARYDSSEDAALPVEGRFDCVINLAMPGAGEAKRAPERALASGARTAAACLALLRAGRAARLIHFSTFHVYGPEAGPDYAETSEPKPQHPYGQAHLAVERQLLASDVANAISVLRPTNLVGAPAHADLGDQAGLVFLDLCRQAGSGAMALRNDGESHRDLLPFGDAIAAIRFMMDSAAPAPGVFNLALGRSQRMSDLAEIIAGAARHPVAVSFGDGVDAYRSPMSVDVSRLGALGWRPAASLADEAARCIRFFAP